MLTLYTFFSKVVKRKKEMFTLRKKSEALAGLFSLIRICWQTWHVFLKIFHSLCLHIHSLSNSFFLPLWASKDPWKHQASMIWAPFGGSAGSCVSAFHYPVKTYWPIGFQDSWLPSSLLWRALWGAVYWLCLMLFIFKVS